MIIVVLNRSLLAYRVFFAVRLGPRMIRTPRTLYNFTRLCKWGGKRVSAFSWRTLIKANSPPFPRRFKFANCFKGFFDVILLHYIIIICIYVCGGFDFLAGPPSAMGGFTKIMNVVLCRRANVYIFLYPYGYMRWFKKCQNGHHLYLRI